MTTALNRTIEHINRNWKGNNKRIAQALWFIKRCKTRDKKDKLEKASRKRNRK